MVESSQLPISPWSQKDYDFGLEGTGLSVEKDESSSAFLSPIIKQGLVGALACSLTGQRSTWYLPALDSYIF